MDPQKITELANLLRNNGDKILNSEFTLTLSGSLLRALNDSFTLIADTTEIGGSQSFQVAKPINSKSPVFRDLQLVYDFVQKTTLLCIIHYPTEEYFEGTIDISKFRALKRLEVQKTNVQQIVGIQPLRAQLQQLICVKSLRAVDDVITHCGGDKSNGFVWNELKIADFSYNNLQTVDTALEFTQHLQHLNLRHNQLQSVEAIKWLPHLKTLDLSFNRLQCIPQFHMEACKRLQSLNMSNNFVEDLMGIARLDALTDLDLSDNCLLDHSYLLPLSALVTLKFLNLYGNPLHYHPKHRLATAQFLHKNTATVKFILDYEPLSKNEKAVTGSQQLRHVGSLNRYATKSATVSISSGRVTPASHTPASSVSSLQSFKLSDNLNDIEASEVAVGVEASAKKRAGKIRTVEICDAVGAVSNDMHQTLDKTATSRVLDQSLQQGDSEVSDSAAARQAENLNRSSIAEPSNEHLEAKKQIENLREKYGVEWLQHGNAEIMQSVLGIDSSESLQQSKMDSSISREQFNDFLGEFSATKIDSVIDNQLNLASNESELTSTPNNESYLKDLHNKKEMNMPSPIRATAQQDSTHFESVLDSESSKSNKTNYQTPCESAEERSEESSHKVNVNDKVEVQDDDDDDEALHLKNVYSTAINEEPELSEPEDEKTYIVYTPKRMEALFLTISEKFIREKDALTQKTKAKWSLKILESCERVKVDTLRINFDTVKVDKQERVYTVEDGLCQELERELRDILSNRDLSEMNQTIYRCVNCSCQFSRENQFKYKKINQIVSCPECNSKFVAEMHDIPESLERASAITGESTGAAKQAFIVDDAVKLSPAAIVEESPVTTPLIVKQNLSTSEVLVEETNSIGSANSLDASSSCSKISKDSQSSFDSNQSVAGSSTTDRDNEFKSNYESDVDILSNPSQSSIEVLDHTLMQQHQQLQPSRKTSMEEWRHLRTPDLEHILDVDHSSYTQKFIDQQLVSLMEMPQQEQQQQQHQQQLQLQQSASSPAIIQPVTNNDVQLTQEPTQPVEEQPEQQPQQQQQQQHAHTTSSQSPSSATKVKSKVPPTMSIGPLTHLNLTESSSSGSVTDSVCTTYENAADKPVSGGGGEEEMHQYPAANDVILHNLLAEETTTPLKNNNINGSGSGRITSKTISGSNNDRRNADKENEKDTGTLKREDSGISSMLGALFQSTNILMSSSKKLIDVESGANIRAGTAIAPTSTCKPYKFNYSDFNDIDHRLKLYFYQVKFEEQNEHFKWIARGRIFNENTHTIFDGLVVMSTCKCYVMEAFAPENDDVTKWLRHLVSVTVDRLECIQLLPWKIGLSFVLRDWGGFLLLLQDILRTDSLLLFFADNSLPSSCTLEYQHAEEVVRRLSSVVAAEKLKMCSLLNGCEITCDEAKRCFDICALLTTDTRLFLTSSKLGWLSPQAVHPNFDTDIEICVTQFMSNLVEVERPAENIFAINFLDETQDKCELWRCTFETKENAESCLNAIGQSWEKLFGVPLLNS